MIIKICKFCKSEFKIWPYEERKGRKLCSKKCFDKIRQNRIERICQVCSKKFQVRKSIIKYRKATFCSFKCRSIVIQKEKHNQWKGDKVGYSGIHMWITKTKGKASKHFCTFNKSHNKSPLQWSNISGKYIRDLSDWWVLCTKCHKKYDLSRL